MDNAPASPRPEVFDLRCRLHFYDSMNYDEQCFVAVPSDRTVLMVLRGRMKTRVPTIANVGRLLGVRYGSTSKLWPDEAKKVGIVSDGYEHDLIQFCLWEPDKIAVPDRVIAAWPQPDLSD